MQLPELPNTPVVGEDVKLTVPVDVLAPLDAVSVTVAVQVVALPNATDVGERATLVDGGSSDVTDGEVPLLVACVLSPP